MKSAKDRKAMAGTYHYNVYLPAGYGADSSKQWPSIFIEIADVKAGLGGKEKFQSWTFDGGHAWAPAEKFAEAASWIIGKAGN